MTGILLCLFISFWIARSWMRHWEKKKAIENENWVEIKKASELLAYKVTRAEVRSFYVSVCHSSYNWNVDKSWIKINKWNKQQKYLQENLYPGFVVHVISLVYVFSLAWFYFHVQHDISLTSKPIKDNFSFYLLSLCY